MNIQNIVDECRNSFNSGITKDVNFIEKQLKCLTLMYEENEDKLFSALLSDLRKEKTESELSELLSIKDEIRLTLTKFREWSKPETPEKTSLSNILDELKIYKDPYGVVLIIGSWNYPLRLILLPLIGALAAGNCVVIKPSELAPASSALIATLVPRYLDKDCYKVVTGGAEETTALLKEKFDYIFFTGSSTVGKIVHKAANDHLTPTTLELGGKCPVYLDGTADIEVATRRILWGKCFNAGQTCIAPDYLICSKDVERKFLETVPKIIEEFYGKNPKNSPHFCRIINSKHFQRIKKLVENTKVFYGGEFDESQLYVSPTIITNIKFDYPIMNEEIFGPVLPIVNFESSDVAINYINSNEKPLALYVFSNDRKCIETFLKETSSGGVTVNDTLVHIATGNLPFGGVGCSGMGAYQGKATFDTFIHKKSVVIKDLGYIGETVGSIRYPPYNANHLPFLKILMRQSYCKYRKYLPHIFMLGLGAFISYCYQIMNQRKEEL